MLKITILHQKIIFFSNCGGRHENFWGISGEKNHDFMPKNNIIFQLRREAQKLLGYFV
jgi:hypothetical protein